MRLSSKIKWKLVILSHVQLLYCKIVQHLNHLKLKCHKIIWECRRNQLLKRKMNLGLNLGKNEFGLQFNFSFFFFWLGHDLGRGLGPNLVGLNRAHVAQRGGSGPCIKNSFIKRARFWPWIQAHETGPRIEKPDPNPTRYHS